MDAHKILGVDKDASPDEIRRAYRKKASQYHPDKGGDVWIFQQIQDAYDELTGKKKKKRKKPKSQASSKQPETPNRQYQNADPFGFDIPDPQPTLSAQSMAKQTQKEKGKCAVAAGCRSCGCSVVASSGFCLCQHNYVWRQIEGAACKR